MPPFAIEGGLPLAVARGLAVAGLFFTLGATLAPVAVLAPALALGDTGGAAALRRCRRLAILSAVVAACGLAAWLGLTAANLAMSTGAGAVVGAVGILLRTTLFGHTLLLQLACLAAAAGAVAWRRRWVAPGFAVLAVVLQAAHGHALSMHPGPSWLLASDIGHLLAGAVWLGELLPLLIAVQTLPAMTAARVCRRFSPIGIGCVLTLVVTAGFQFFVLIGGLPRLLGTAYGLMALLKIVLFAGLFGIAALNRQRLTPALVGGDPRLARQNMRRSLAVETTIGLLVVLAAGVLSSLPPAMDMG